MGADEENGENGGVREFDELKFINDPNNPRNAYEKFFFAMYRMVDGPVTWFRENVVLANRPKTVYYHQKFRRVPTIDECPIEENLCFFEANIQYRRDKQVDDRILQILRQRRTDCIYYNKQDAKELCAEIMKQYLDAETAWFIKYGDLGAVGNVKTAYMKQKHRLVYERRHGRDFLRKPSEPVESEEA